MKTVILTSYLSKKPHPQYGDPSIVGAFKDGRVKRNDFSYIEKWYNSVLGLDLEARIFYDNLSDVFISKYTTDKIKFIKTDVESTIYSNNDWRFFCYYSYLKENIHEAAFMVDCSDVVVVKDPSELAKDESYDFFIGEDAIKWSGYGFGSFSYTQIHEACGWHGLDFFKEKSQSLPLLNMGVVGGTYPNVLDFLNLFVKGRESSQIDLNINMALGQFIFRYVLKESNLCVGFPVTSEYKQYQNDRRDVYFIHK